MGTRELRRQLEELKVREVIKHQISFSHGRILRPDNPNMLAFINIGSRERVVPGLKFLVGRRGIHKKFTYKGKIEVKKAWRTYSEVSIIELYEPLRGPMIDGDLIVNPLFDKSRPMVVTFVGEEGPNRQMKFTIDEATRRIKEIGSTVRKGISLDLDYVIFTTPGTDRGPETYPGYQKALSLEIPVANAVTTKSQVGLFEFLGD